MADLLPWSLSLTGRAVVLVGGGRVAAAKLQQLLAVSARVRIVAPDISAATVDVIAGGTYRVEIVPRPFAATDLDGAWLVVAAPTPEVNRQVAEAAAEPRPFVDAVRGP